MSEPHTRDGEADIHEVPDSWVTVVPAYFWTLPQKPLVCILNSVLHYCHIIHVPRSRSGKLSLAVETNFQISVA